MMIYLAIVDTCILVLLCVWFYLDKVRK